MLMHNPPHPGQILRRMLIDEAHMTVTEVAKALGIGRTTLSNVMKGKSSLTPEMAVCLSIMLNTSSEMWMNMQSMYDLWQAEKKRKQLKKKILMLINEIRKAHKTTHLKLNKLPTKHMLEERHKY